MQESMMLPDNESINKLLEKQVPPCISIYQPTHRRIRENEKDPLLFKNLLRQVETSLMKSYRSAEIRSLLKPLERLVTDSNFWNHQLDGLAVLSSKETLQIYKLPRKVKEFAVIADSFHIKPLIRTMQTNQKYHVLALSLKRVALYSGDRFNFEEIDSSNTLPQSMEEVLGDREAQPHLTVAAYAGTSPRIGRHGKTPMHHGHAGELDKSDDDLLRFFRAVDTAMWKHYSRDSSIPLVLAALKEHQSTFHRISRNHYLLSRGVEQNPFSLSEDELHKKVWEVFDPVYRKRQADLVEAYNNARARDLATDSLQDIASAVSTGRVSTLMIDAEKNVAGKLTNGSGGIKFTEIDDPDTDDLLDDLAEAALTRGGTVLVMSKEHIPGDSGAAAIYRY